jgi:polyisoprenyl-teichoic acid--peptidoglycan teichoic acid transferase
MYSRRQRHIRKRVVVALIVFFLLIGGLIIFSVGKFVPALFELAFKKEIQLKETKEKRVNILLLGVGGGNHEGPDLTDTIILASIDPKMQKVTLVSVPRDLWMPELTAKINTAYTFGEEKKNGGGLVLAKATVSKLLGQQIDYAFKIDFDGFIKAVDMMGGLDVDVTNQLDDYAYPIEGKETEACEHTEEEIIDLTAQIATGSATDFESFPCRYEHLHFDPGVQHMDGVTALKYVRSRHALGAEGSDFARSKRQEKVIAAFKDKMFSAGTLLNPVKLTNLGSVLAGSIETDIKENEYDDFVKLAKKVQGGTIDSVALDTGDAAEDRYGLLINPPISEEYRKAWVLAPRIGNGEYSEIQEYVGCRIENILCEVGVNGILTPTPTITPTKAN